MSRGAAAGPMDEDDLRGPGPFARLLDVRVEHVPGRSECEVTMMARHDHERSGGVVHGGVQMSLLDMAMAGAVNATLGEGETCATASMTIDFMRPARAGRLVARGRVGRRGRTMAFPSSELVDEKGEVVARASGVWAIRPARVA